MIKLTNRKEKMFANAGFGHVDVVFRTNATEIMAETLTFQQNKTQYCINILSIFAIIN
jgi:hypothetical protein